MSMGTAPEIGTGTTVPYNYFSNAYNAQVFQYYGIVVCVVYMCDYIETLAEEVEYMWKGRRWNVARILYFWSRYIPMASIPLLFALYTPNMTSLACRSLHTAVLVISWAGEAFPIAILLLCLYALYGSKKSLLWMFATSFSVLMLGLLATQAVFITTLIVPDAQYRGGNCFTLNLPMGDRVVLANRLIRIGAHFIMVGLAFCQGVIRSREVNSPVFKAIHEGGMLYYLGIFAMAALDIAARYYSPNDHARLKNLTYFSRFGAPILANRLLIRMYTEIRIGTESVAVHSMPGLKFSPRRMTTGSYQGSSGNGTTTVATTVSTMSAVTPRDNTNKKMSYQSSKNEESFVDI